MECVLCGSDKKNDVAYGEILRKKNVSVHEFCLYLSSGLAQAGRENDGLFGFLPKHILEESKRAQQLYCVYCRKQRANIGCCEKKCRRSFHLICGLENGAENHFTGTFNSYCDRHGRKKNKVPCNECCCICYDRLVDGNESNHSRKVILSPCCKNGWFHRTCLQGFARSSGYFFKCPLCNDTEKFRAAIPYYGIFIRDADAAWEMEPNAFSELLHRPSKCEAETCRHKNGREAKDSERNPLVCCQICGSVAVHKMCNKNRNQIFICAECQKIIDLRNSILDGDSGRESIQPDDVENEVEEEEIIDICNINDSDDEDDDFIVRRRNFKKISKQVIRDDSGEESSYSKHSVRNFDNYPKTEKDIDVPETKSSNISKKSVHRFSYDSCIDGAVSVEVSSTYKTDNDSDCSSIKTINRRRKLRISDSSKTSDYESTANNKSVSVEIDENDDDPLDYLPKILAKDKTQHHTQIPSKKTKTVDRPTFDAHPHTSKILNGNHKKQSDIFLPNQKIPNTNVAFKENDNDSMVVKPNSCANLLQISPFEISCVGNRTRYRTRTFSSQVNEKRLRSLSSTSSSSSNDKNERGEHNSINVSCVANRTRRRKSIYYPENNLGIISEENFSESSDSYQTPSKKSKCAHERLNYVNDEGFHLAQSSEDDELPYSNQYSVSVNSLRRQRNRRFRLISLTTDDELSENDAMKIR